MQKLYLDCDEVILNTINESYKIINSLGLTNEREIANFYRNLNWDNFIIQSGEINNSVSKIKCLEEKFDIEILTHVCSAKEAAAKRRYFKKMLPDVKFTSVPKEISKADYVPARGAILVDDYLPNLIDWESKGGIPIKYSDSGKKCPYMVVTDLSELLNIDINCKKKIREEKAWQ